MIINDVSVKTLDGTIVSCGMFRNIWWRVWGKPRRIQDRTVGLRSGYKRVPFDACQKLS